MTSLQQEASFTFFLEELGLNLMTLSLRGRFSATALPWNIFAAHRLRHIGFIRVYCTQDSTSQAFACNGMVLWRFLLCFPLNFASFYLKLLSSAALRYSALIALLILKPMTVLLFPFSRILGCCFNGNRTSSTQRLCLCIEPLQQHLGYLRALLPHWLFSVISLVLVGLVFITLRHFT